MPDISNGDMTIKDSGARRVFASGAHRDRAVGKGAFHLLPYNALLEVAKVFETGALKYSSNNWKLGMPVSEYLNSGLRHGMKAAAGWNDEPHMAQAAWNFLCAIETLWMVRQGLLPADLDDVQNWLTAEGVEKAFAAIRLENERRRAETAADATAAGRP